MGFKSLIIASVLVGLFVFAMFQGFNQLATDNNATNILFEDEAVNSTAQDLEAELADVNRTANNLRGAFDEEKSSFASGFLLFGSILDAAKQLMDVFVKVYELTFGLMAKRIGIPPIVIGVFASILLISAVLLAWRVLKQGS